MKHTWKITAIILGMFLITQFIGLYVVNYYSQERVIDGKIVKVENSNSLPYGLEVPKEKQQDTELSFFSILISFLFAILLLSLLMKIRAKFVVRLWFFVVTILALGISFNSILPEFQFGFINTSLVALSVGLFLATGKVYKKNIIFHNLSELFIYPGIAAIFVLMLNLTWIVVLLVLISIYDMWAVWKSGIMQKMAKFQMDELHIFSGFFVPYISKKVRKQLSKIKKLKRKDRKVKVNIAILGGGDVIFPIIASGVVLKTWGLWPAVAVISGAFMGLAFLLISSEKKKFHPAMPFITAGIFLALLLGWIFI